MEKVQYSRIEIRVVANGFYVVPIDPNRLEDCINLVLQREIQVFNSFENLCVWLKNHLADHAPIEGHPNELEWTQVLRDDAANP